MRQASDMRRSLLEVAGMPLDMAAYIDAGMERSACVGFLDS